MVELACFKTGNVLSILTLLCSFVFRVRDHNNAITRDAVAEWNVKDGIE